MNNQWSDKLRKRMEVHEEQTPQGLWDDIEQIMLQDTLEQSVESPKLFMLWVKRISAVAAILLLVLCLGYLFVDNSQLEIQLVEEMPKKDTPKINDPFVADNKILPNPIVVDDKYVDTNLRTQKRKISIEIDTISVVHTTASLDADASDADKEKVNADEPKKDDSKKIEPRPKINSLTPESEFIFKELPKEKKSNWGTNIYASNLAPQANNKYSGYSNLASYAMELESTDGKTAMVGNAYGNILLANQYEEVYTDVKHNQPISVGISADYKIDDRWSLRSGLIYTYLSSKLHSGSDNNYYSSNQSLHYLGIPLNVNFNVWQNNKLAFYVSGGALAEKNISGKLKTDYIVANQLSHTKNSSIKIDQIQWSANASIGAQYNLSDRIGMYFEPGVSYYFENKKSQIETIYKAKQWNLSLRLGLSFSLGGR